MLIAPPKTEVWIRPCQYTDWINDQFTGHFTDQYPAKLDLL